MPDISPRLDVTLAQRLELRLYMGMKISHSLDAPRAEFWEEVRRLEESPLFMKLFNPAQRSRKAIRIVPRKPVYFLENLNRPLRDAGDVESLLEGMEAILPQVRALGEERFSSLFLSGEQVSDAELMEATGLTAAQLAEFREQVLDKVFIADIFEKGRGPSPAGCVQVERIGRISLEDGALRFEAFLERSRYEVDGARVQEILEGGELTRKEAQEVKSLLQTLELVNLRFDLYHQVALHLMEKQPAFITSGSADDLVPLEERDVAGALGVHPSWLCRLIQHRTVHTPRGEMPLRRFFLTRRQARRTKGRRALAEILRGGSAHLSDAQLGRLLHGRTGMSIARRTVNVWRREIEREGLDAR